MLAMMSEAVRPSVVEFAADVVAATEQLLESFSGTQRPDSAFRNPFIAHPLLYLYAYFQNPAPVQAPPSPPRHAHLLRKCARAYGGIAPFGLFVCMVCSV